MTKKRWPSPPFRSAGSARRTISARRRYSSPRTTAATSPVLNCSWTAARFRSEQVLPAVSIAASLISQEKLHMTDGSRKLRFGLWYDFRNPAQWRQPSDRLYREILDQIAWGENNGFDDVWLSEHHFIEDGYLPSILPVAAAVAARTKRIRIASGVLLMPFHNPVRLAEDIAVVDVISGGRFELGVGVGFKLEEFDSFGVSFRERGSEALPSSVSNRYSLSIRTHGSSCRRRATSSPRRVNSFSSLSSSSRAASHCSRVPVLYIGIVLSPFSRLVMVPLCISPAAALFPLRASARLRIITRLGNQTKIVSAERELR